MLVEGRLAVQWQESVWCQETSRVAVKRARTTAECEGALRRQAERVDGRIDGLWDVNVSVRHG